MLLANHACSKMIFVMFRRFGGGPKNGKMPLFLWAERKFAIYAVFVKTALFFGREQDLDGGNCALVIGF